MKSPRTITLNAYRYNDNGQKFISLSPFVSGIREDVKVTVTLGDGLTVNTKLEIAQFSQGRYPVRIMELLANGRATITA